VAAVVLILIYTIPDGESMVVSACRSSTILYLMARAWSSERAEGQAPP
jgi:hypothetical protein